MVPEGSPRGQAPGPEGEVVPVKGTNHLFLLVFPCPELPFRPEKHGAIRPRVSCRVRPYPVT